MSSYFDQVEQTMGDAVQRLAHKPWHVRLLQRIRRRPLPAVVIATLVIAAPAVGAVTHWYGIGAPNHPQSQAQAFGVGNAIAGRVRLLPLRVPDSQGGPPWGIRYVTTQNGACQEFGRVEHGQLGSLGIDDYWHNDHLFHPYPVNWVGQSCGNGGGGGGAGITSASGNVPTYHAGKQTDGCTTHPAATTGRPTCPRGSLRIFIVLTLGASVKSITYRAPSGALRTEQSPDSHGTFLLVFPLNAATCRFYLDGHLTNSGTCQRSLRGNQGRPPTTPMSAAIKTLNLADGRSCNVRGPGLFANCRH